MNQSNGEMPGIPNFNDRYATYTDEQILEILRSHKDYQDAAVDAAVKIAIERQLIHSEQDLFSPEFQVSRKYRVTLFPEITSAFHHQRLLASIFRFLYLFSLLPVVYGVLKYAEGKIDQTFWGIGAGIIWFLFSIALNRTRRLIFLVPLIALLALIAVAAGMKIFSTEILAVQDLIIYIIGILMPAYFLFYVKKLLQTNYQDK